VSDAQHEIVRRVETLFRRADRAEQRLAAATAQAGKLTVAILARAFRWGKKSVYISSLPPEIPPDFQNFGPAAPSRRSSATCDTTAALLCARSC
jgi:hypothetical protein